MSEISQPNTKKQWFASFRNLGFAGIIYLCKSWLHSFNCSASGDVQTNFEFIWSWISFFKTTFSFVFIHVILASAIWLQLDLFVLKNIYIYIYIYIYILNDHDVLGSLTRELLCTRRTVSKRYACECIYLIYLVF